MTLGSHLLGRVAPPDDRHLQLHPFAEAAPPQGIEVQIKLPTLDVYDQGDSPECVAFSFSKVVNHFNRYAFDAPWLYKQCKAIDGYAGDGTSARYACDVLRSKGHWRRIQRATGGWVDVKAGPQKAHGIASNTWATSVDQIRSVFARPVPQPVLIGSDWYHAWFKPQLRDSYEYWLQDIPKAGTIDGGHQWGLWGCSDRRQAFELSNTWGSLFPVRVWVAYETIDTLLGNQADACVIKDLATR
jgi:hypothetical protein